MTDDRRRASVFSFSWWLPAPLGLSIALALSGCTKELNTDAIAKRIRELATQQGAAVRSVKCPEDVKAKKGESFTCTLTYASGERQIVHVHQQDAHGRVTITAGDRQ